MTGEDRRRPGPNTIGRSVKVWFPPGHSKTPDFAARLLVYRQHKLTAAGPTPEDAKIRVEHRRRSVTKDVLQRPKIGTPQQLTPQRAANQTGGAEAGTNHFTVGNR